MHTMLGEIIIQIVHTFKQETHGTIINKTASFDVDFNYKYEDGECRFCYPIRVGEAMRKKHLEDGNNCEEILTLIADFDTFMVVPNGYVLKYDIAGKKNFKIDALVEKWKNPLPISGLGAFGGAPLQFPDAGWQAPPVPGGFSLSPPVNVVNWDQFPSLTELQ